MAMKETVHMDVGYDKLIIGNLQLPYQFIVCLNEIKYQTSLWNSKLYILFA